MVGSTRFGLLLCGGITSDAVLRLSLDGISRRLETRLGASGRFLGFGRRRPKGTFRLTAPALADGLFGILRKSVVNVSKLTERFGCLLFLEVSLMLLKDQLIRGVQINLGYT
jgi:hypothetical protein